MEKICPKDGMVCPVQVVLETAEAMAATDTERKSIADLKYGVLGAIVRQASQGTCEGPTRDDDGLSIKIKCGNSKSDAMKQVYEIQRDARDHIVDLPHLDLPEEVLYITKNE